MCFRLQEKRRKRIENLALPRGPIDRFSVDFPPFYLKTEANPASETLFII